MSKLKYVIRYFVKNYPHSNELSKTRLTKMVYLADWFSAFLKDKQITDIEWYFDHYGPYVPDVYEVARNDNQLSISNTLSAYGSPKELITFNEDNHKSLLEKLGLVDDLTTEDKEILDKVIKQTETLTWDSFIKLVYSTYPIKSQHRYSNLDLVELAREYKSQNPKSLVSS